MKSGTRNKAVGSNLLWDHFMGKIYKLKNLYYKKCMRERERQKGDYYSWKVRSKNFTMEEEKIEKLFK